MNLLHESVFISPIPAKKEIHLAVIEFYNINTAKHEMWRKVKEEKTNGFGQKFLMGRRPGCPSV